MFGASSQQIRIDELERRVRTLEGMVRRLADSAGLSADQVTDLAVDDYARSTGR